ncbi:glycosyltransferase family 4 protein [Bacteroides sp. UBA939]|uniref:glycosyltransferase family 4 protein n=1 Tax=Bacteroides sp. UBA939 TaxID=1946092 RepID=UPI0025BADBAA|nr:glycosyltransferase family 4 protein [Bacteroides sp. UBA939]
MRILHIIYSFNAGGAERMVITLANHQVKRNRVGLCIINNLYSQDLLDELDDRIPQFCINRKKGSRNIFDVLRLNWCILKFRPDVLHIHDADAVLYIPISRFYYTLLTIHATDLPLTGIERYDRTVAISKAVACNTEKRGFMKPDMVYNGISTSAIQHVKRDASGSKPNFRIVQVGRLEHTVKGQHLLLEALHKLSSPYVTVDFVGDGSSYGYLMEMTGKLNLENQVRFLGYRNIKWIYRHLCDYQLLVQPSLSEGFGLTIAEAMVAGIPVLVSNLAAPLEVIGEGAFGYYFMCGDADNLCRMLQQIISNYEEALRVSDKGREYALTNFDYIKMAENYANLYTE